MEEVQLIDCPPTPEILIASATPPSAALLDLLDSSSSAEELDSCTGNGLGEGTSESGRSSPPPKCAICLGKCRQKCYTDSCRHQFCYRCLLEWSKIKAECPLCKQVFRSIIYNQKSFDQCQEHIISIVPPASPPESSQASGSLGGAARVAPEVYHRLDFTLSQPPRFTYSATLRVQQSQSERLQQLFLHQSGDVQRFSREYPDDSIPSRQNGPEWRRYIYHRKLHARPLPDINGRMRECSAAFYRENPAQIHRLMPWINRELIALCRANPTQVTLLIEDFPNLLMSHDITSPAFRERVCYWGRARTAHFIHELLNFARSPYDMIGYDRCVQYDPYYNSVVVLSSSSSSSSGSGLSGSDGEDDVVRVVEPIPGTSGTMETVAGPNGGSRRGRTQFTIETRSSDQTVIMTGSFGGTGVSGIVSVSTSGTQTNGAGNSSSNSQYPDMTRLNPLTALSAHNINRLEDGENISLSSSDSDDCRIVGALKPPHLRTPEMVSLESESDSDVVFVNEAADTRREQPVPTQNATLEQLFPQGGHTQSTVSKLDPSASEYNNGASTSSGGGGGGGGFIGEGMKKFYARPRLNRYSDGIGFKSIYEASESEQSAGEPSVKSDSVSSSHDEVKFNIHPQAPKSVRKRKAVKRRQNSSCCSDSSEQSSTDSESSPSSSSTTTCSSSSSSSTSDSDSEREPQSGKPIKLIIQKKRPRRSKYVTAKKTPKRKRKEPKRRSKVKKRKSSTKTRSKRQKVSSKAPKSSSESGKGTSVSCTSIPSAETMASGSNTSPKLAAGSPRKRKLYSIAVKPNAAKVSAPTCAKKRRKTPICAELIDSTDFSSDDNAPISVMAPQPALSEPVAQFHHAASTGCSSFSSAEESTDSEGKRTIASLIRAAKRASRDEQQSAAAAAAGQSNASATSNTTTTTTTSSSSSGSGSSSSSSRSTLSLSCSNSSITEEATSSPVSGRTQPHHPSEQEDDSVSVAQAIPVGAEVEL